MRKKRGYKRDKPTNLVKDYKLFAIACEGGKREPEYFGVFEHISRRIKIDIIEDIVTDDEMEKSYETKSAPKWVLDRAVKYIEKEGLIEEDNLWFVIDKDKWSEDQIREIADLCNEKPNWHIVISNPCFEIWLYFHKKVKIPNSIINSCKILKKEVSMLEIGGYNQYKFIPNLLDAILSSKKNDTNKEHFFPNVGETKVYQLGEALINAIGVNDFNEFVENKLQKMIFTSKLARKVRKKR